MVRLSLLAVAGMFIFGGKKKAEKTNEREKYEKELEELSKKYGISVEKLENIGLFTVYNGGQARILQKALGIPEKSCLRC